MNSLLEKYVDVFRAGDGVTVDEAEPLLDAMITSDDKPMLAKLLEAWHRKGIGEDEIYGIARVMRDRCTKIESRHDRFIDIVGTGGSRVKTFNVSTAAAFVVAGAGVPVAKHGNKAATSNSGSADVLSELSVEPAVDPRTAERCLNEIGICFMFAPNFHRLSPTLATVRRGLGFPTIFNCVGPLCNPANAPHQLIGVWDAEMAPKVAGALAKLGTRKSWVVHGRDGLDEISISDRTVVSEVEGTSVSSYEIGPEDLGLERTPADDIRAEDAKQSASIIQAVLRGTAEGYAAENITVLNAAAALYISGHANDLRDAAQVAVDSIRSGRALNKLDQLAKAVRG